MSMTQEEHEKQRLACLDIIEDERAGYQAVIERLIRQQEEYELLFQESLNGIALHEMIFDADGRPVDYRFLRVNKAFQRLTGLEAVKVMGRTVREVLPGLEQGWIERYGKVVVSGESDHFEEYSQSLDKWFEVTAYCIGEERFVATFSDITSRVRQQKLLEQEGKFLATVIDSVQDGLTVLDTEYNIVAANSELSALYPDQSSLVGQKCYVAFQQRQEPCPWCPSRRAIETGEKQSEIVPHPSAVRPDKWFHLTASPIKDATGKVTGVVEHVADVTVKKLSEDWLLEQKNFLDTVLESLPHPFMVINAADYTVAHANTLAAPDGLPLGTTCYALTHKREQPCTASEEHECPLRGVVQTGKPFLALHTHFDLNGEPRYVEVHASPIFDMHGRVVQVIESTIDVTERKREEVEKERILQELQAAFAQIRTLKGILPICAWCKKIRNEKGEWELIEAYIQRNSEANFSHGICTECFEQRYGELSDNEQ